MSEIQPANITNMFKTHSSYFFTFFATLGGVLVGVVSSMAMMGPMLQSQIASATEDASRTIATSPASLTTTCQAAEGGETPVRAKAETASAALAPEVGGKGGDAPVGSNTWVNHLVTGTWNTGNISNTGSDSTNAITTTNSNTTRVTNTNNVTVTNNNAQTAASGNVESTNNSTAGSAASGTAANTSHSEYDITVTN